MDLNAFIPPFATASLVATFSICRFENQRWVRARLSGHRGASQLGGLLVDATGAVSAIFSLGFLAAYWFDFGWRQMLGLFVIGSISSIIYTLICTQIFKGDSFLLWMMGTLGVWLLFLPLALRVSWFGLF